VEIERLWEGSDYAWPEDCHIPIKTEDFTELIFDDKDQAFQREIALLGPIKDGQPIFEGVDPPPSRETILSVKLDDVESLHNMVSEDYGAVVESGGDIGEEATIWAQTADNTCYLWAHKTCLALLHSFTRFTTSTFWDLFRHTNTKQFEIIACLLKGIDYLEISGSHEQFVFAWRAVQGDKMRDAFYKLQTLPTPLSSLRRLLLEDGQMWVFVAPDWYVSSEHVICTPKCANLHIFKLPDQTSYFPWFVDVPRASF
jgi:hypothetical protein